MPQLIDDLDLFNKVLDRLLGYIPLAKFLDGDLGAKPLALVDISITTAAYEVTFTVE